MTSEGVAWIAPIPSILFEENQRKELITSILLQKQTNIFVFHTIDIYLVKMKSSEILIVSYKRLFKTVLNLNYKQTTHVTLKLENSEFKKNEKFFLSKKNYS